MAHPFCSGRPHNQLIILTAKRCTGQTIQIARLNRNLLQKSCQLVLTMGDERQVSLSLNTMSAMPSCKCWGWGVSRKDHGTCKFI